MSEAHVCQRCYEHELELHGQWAQCPGCGAGFLASELEAIEKSAAAAALTREARACFYEEAKRPRKGGGGDDGLSLTHDRAYVDDSIVRVTAVKTKSKVLRIKNLNCTSLEAQEAILALIRKELLLD